MQQCNDFISGRDVGRKRLNALRFFPDIYDTIKVVAYRKAVKSMDRQIVAVYRREQCLIPRVRLAGSFATRWRGLMFYPQMPGIDGLLLYPCHAVHMLGMRFALSLIYLDRQGRILRLVDRIAPFRPGPVVRGAYYVLETYPGLPGKMQMAHGQQLRWGECLRDQSRKQPLVWRIL
jgi:uncharacterized membrane protein (UPF0127 family)